jgi:putative transcriptional regulator
MKRPFDDLLQQLGYRLPRRRRKRSLDEQPEGLVRPPMRPTSHVEKNPLADPLAGIKRPLRAPNGQTRGRSPVEFDPVAIIEIRYKFHATQRQFARMFGISVETLRNWEQGKRRPQGPARALLRVAAGNPDEVLRTLWRYRRAWWMDELGEGPPRR